MTTIKAAVLSTIEQHIDQQNAKGMKNYGQTLDDCPVEDYSWQNMIIEELIDALQYQQKEMKRLNLQYELQKTQTELMAKLADRYREGILQ